MLAYGPLPLDKKANTSIKIFQVTPPKNNTDFYADLWHVNRKSLLNILCDYREIFNCKIRARNSRKEFPLWEKCDGRFSKRRSQKHNFYRVLLFARTRQDCRLRELRCNSSTSDISSLNFTAVELSSDVYVLSLLEDFDLTTKQSLAKDYCIRLSHQELSSIAACLSFSAFCRLEETKL